MFNSDRLKTARERRMLTAKGLAERVGVSAVTLSKYENGHAPDEATAKRLAMALSYPLDFFFREAPERIDTDAVSFRSLARMKAKERRAAEAAGSLGIELYEWIDARFNLPSADLIDLSKERRRPFVAARLLRQHWGLGDRPIGNVLKLIESKGIRVLSLSEATKNVDAYSFWRGEHPYVFLNQEKTAERSIFDTAHELGHLVLHHHADSKTDKEAETQADRFASAFLMPESDVMDYAHLFTAGQIIAAKKRWKVSAMALAYRLNSLGYISEWNYRSLLIELGKRGYRSGEPDGIEREVSTVLAKVLAALWSKGMTKENIARDLGIPLEEIEALIFRLSPDQGASLEVRKPSLRVVK
ncbi:helix-turn-helix domain-containing protein [Roseobacter ponti]|uniref:ImmA/IrrE family metallo-endopeptidase n=1 Tax=Roseobacter ponti TaxID=1891787 RepID=A0A858SSX3_9RHOB|nr:ImmA/IrrE family metallo-endopeptidase [Roseobacter ponti]QJF51087.1 ImmA/IrrE family metallo-endopeptidase [Roseobacter ponti]